jgi:ribonuclease-3
LQEWLQARKMKLPAYRVVATLGEAHKQTFDVECTVTETGQAERGIGASRRAGEQAAAAAMLQRLTVDPRQAVALPPAADTVAPSAKSP